MLESSDLTSLFLVFFLFKADLWDTNLQKCILGFGFPFASRRGFERKIGRNWWVFWYGALTENTTVASFKWCQSSI
jgi:hypothetical protein